MSAPIAWLVGLAVGFAWGHARGCALQARRARELFRTLQAVADAQDEQGPAAWSPQLELWGSVDGHARPLDPGDQR